MDPKVGEALDYTVFLSGEEMRGGGDGNKKSQRGLGRFLDLTGYSRLLSKPLMLSSKEKDTRRNTCVTGVGSIDIRPQQAAPASSRALVLMQRAEPCLELQYVSVCQYVGRVQNSRVCSVTLIYINWFGRSIFMSLL